jgi:hypothetical protein
MAPVSKYSYCHTTEEYCNPWFQMLTTILNFGAIEMQTEIKEMLKKIQKKKIPKIGKTPNAVPTAVENANFLGSAPLNFIKRISIEYI